MPASCFAVTFILFMMSVSAWADGKDTEGPSGSHSGHKKVQDPSFQELLEFLGQWETDRGNWIDPSDLDWLITPDQESTRDEKNKP